MSESFPVFLFLTYFSLEIRLEFPAQFACFLFTDFPPPISVSLSSNPYFYLFTYPFFLFQHPAVISFPHFQIFSLNPFLLLYSPSYLIRFSFLLSWLHILFPTSVFALLTSSPCYSLLFSSPSFIFFFACSSLTSFRSRLPPFFPSCHRDPYHLLHPFSPSFHWCSTSLTKHLTKWSEA